MSKIKHIQFVFDDGEIVTAAIPEDEIIADMLDGLYPVIVNNMVSGAFIFIKTKPGGYRFFTTGKETEEKAIAVLTQRNNIK